MKRRTSLLALLALLLGSQAAGETAPPPNIVVIFADDLGYGDLGSFGSMAIRTPELDRMASEGMRMTSFYSVAPVCTPSRAGLLTGRYPARMGAEQLRLENVLFPSDTTGLLQSETTVARALRKHGYATACIGKWHLGHVEPHRAIDHGFDYYFGIPYSNDMRPTPLVRNSETIEEPARQDTLTRRYTEEAVAFMERSKEKPFFLYLAHTMPHIPLHATERFLGKSPAGLYGDVVEELDWSVGEVLGALRRLGLERRTFVLFTSDNGPWYQGSAGPLRGRKGSTWEGGVRVPAIVWAPGRVSPGSVSDEPAAAIDLFPTALALAGVDPAGAAGLPLDGRSILPLLTGEERRSPHDMLLLFDGVHLQTVRYGKWKLHLARWNIPRYTAASSQKRNVALSRPELFNLEVDAGESYDLAGGMPDVVGEIRAAVARSLETFPDEIRAANEGFTRPPGDANPAPRSP